MLLQVQSTISYEAIKSLQISYQAVHTAFDALITEGPDHEALDVAMATVVANTMLGDALAIFMVAPPSSSKTEIALACSGVSSSQVLSTFTSKSLASGLPSTAAAGKRTSALDRFKIDGVSTVILKEFGSILSGHRETRNEIFGQLRDVLDGQYRKAFGNGVVVEWQGTLGILACVTDEIDQHMNTLRKLGDRWLIVRIKVPQTIKSRQAVAMAAMESDDRYTAARVTLREMVAAHVKNVLSLTTKDVEVRDAERWMIGTIAEYLARVRTPTDRDQQRELRSIPSPEGAARVAKQLLKLNKALARVRGHWLLGPTDDPGVVIGASTDDLHTIERVARDSTPQVRLDILGLLGRPTQANVIASRLGLSYSVVETVYLQDLKALGLASCKSAERQQGSEGRSPFEWSLTESPPY